MDAGGSIWGGIVLGAGVVSFLLGCGAGSDDPDRSDQLAVDASSPEAIAESTGCGHVSELDSMVSPIRGMAATRGIRCDIDGEVLHVFARAPRGDPAAGSYAAQQGGSLENIYRTLGGGELAQSSCSVALLVSDHVLVLGRSEAVLSGLGIPGEGPVPVSPTVSYLAACALD
jgi:hypothetical protein